MDEETQETEGARKGAKENVFKYVYTNNSDSLREIFERLDK